MRSKKSASQKLTVVLLSVILVLCCTIGGTLAWLSAESEAVTNTFTVGDINIKLQEYPFKKNADGSISTIELDENADPVQKIETYKVVPGGNQPKKPFVTVEKKSENCYVYVSIVNKLIIGNEVVVNYNEPAGWTLVGSKTEADAVTKLYRYNNVVEYNETEDQKLTVFTTVSYLNTITKDTIKELNGKTIELQAFAHQSDNTTQDVADAAACTKFGVTLLPNP